jgi:uncharacterized repeat protein (TIGR01451 family)
MNLRPFLLLGLLALPNGQVRGQLPPPPPPLPVRGPSPLLFVRFQAPPGMRATFFQGWAPARSFPAPVVVGLRPGYCYRMQLSGLVEERDVRLFPSIEVRGSLCLSPNLNVASFPAPVELTQADIESAVAGNLVTKVVFLENPDLAEPIATVPGQTLESERPASWDLLREARDRGRVMLVIRLGGRQVEPAELAAGSIPGTILFPGERAIMPPLLPPTLPTACWPWFDPVLGPRPLDEECLHDGGDRWTRAALGPGGRLVGLDPEDTVAEFTDCKGRRGITCSTRVCLCVPRYLVLRNELPSLQHEVVLGPFDTRAVKKGILLEEQTPPLLASQTKQLEGFRGQVRPSINVALKSPGLLVGLKVLEAHDVVLGPVELLGTVEARRLTEIQKTILFQQMKFALEMSGPVKLSETVGVKGPAVVGRTEGPELVVATVETRDFTVCCHEAPCPPDKPLLLIKCADRHSAQVGEEVTFTLKYSNHGGRPISDIAVSDSLSGRLEYVPDSAESDRNAVLTIQENEAGSVILRWEISGKLLPGQSGRLKFKARVR